MFLGIMGIVMMVVILAAIMSNKVPTIIALALIPCIFCVIVGGAAGLSDYVAAGIKSVAATGTMFIFSILFFGVLTDAGTFRPIVKGVLKVVGNDPVKITVGSAILAMIVHLDGSGVVTFMVCIPALLPLYKKLGMRPMTLAMVVALAAGVMNIEPWGGPTLRAATGLAISTTQLYNAMIPAQIAGLVAVLVIAYLLGKKEKEFVIKTGGLGSEAYAGTFVADMNSSEEDDALLRPKMFIPNLILIILSIVCMIAGWLSNTLTFILASCIALMINYPNPKAQMARINAHAKNIVLMVAVIFASGVLSGVMSGSGMSDGITQLIMAITPQNAGGLLPLLFGILAVPVMFFIPMEAFFFAILPVLSNVAVNFGIGYEMVARASLSANATVAFPFTPLSAAAILLVGMCGLEWGPWQRKGIPLAIIVGWVILLVLYITGAVTF
ncbi:CitMHS family transporter [Papillibacter cinnamivorans]|uniref:Citrate-Mg2+:H+ or citrate-Ca2+:H+ symporter, CitMHS family n=1 Tax=Papillibacter cinnamivorans DSM 12816 TaxID=1122930 RepID=A0A1W2A413_9FIRM|nr:citrate:proton symporter [Papillibacter cinnamivorans]SMC55414.1 citrate-Mg2+:H+ or citrate-Ca2+:H+ symporter, CitMHS family [Papillibacter cinnamivorans DSM 12816]